MSTIKVNSIKNASTDDGGIAIDNSGHVQIDGQQLPTTGPLSARNLLVNGSMIISQRATQVTGSTNTGYKTCDRWRINNSNLGTWTIDQSTDAPAGFSNSLKITCTTADASPGTTDNINLHQRIEGRDVQSLAFGTSSAKQFTVSFYVKSNKTGNASFAVLHTDGSTKMVSFQYTISSANTWEYKTITVPANTADAFDNDSNRSMQVEWWLSSGSTYTGGGSHQTTWAALSQTKRNASNLGIGGAVNDYFQITGIQLEVGEKATPFEHRSFSDELARCQRYYQQINGTSAYTLYGNGRAGSTTNVRILIFLKKTMRSVPTFASSGTFTTTPGGTVTGMSVTHSTADAVQLSVTSTSLVSGSVAGLNASNDSDTNLQFSAEL